MSVDALIDEIRAAEGGAGPGGPAGEDDAELAVATRLRVMRSLKARARSRHQLIGFATAVAILLGGTVSWALATGQVAALWSPAPALAPQPPSQPAIAPAIAPQRPARRPAPPQQPPQPAPPQSEPPQPAVSIDPRPAQPELQPPEAVPAAPPAPRPVTAPQPPRRAAAAVEVLYRRAHDLHFHGGDPAVALAAWDAYLAAEPDGRFAVEARYNRALVLVRLGRHGEARAALAPFARGEVAPAGYRQAEAEQLVERLARYP